MASIRSGEQIIAENLKLREEIEKRHGKTLEQLYEEREKRARDAINLKVPDRVPLVINPDPSTRGGLSHAAAYYDPSTWRAEIKKETLEFEPDLCNTGTVNSGPSWDALDVKNRMWPGGNLPSDVPYQFIEGEYMKADEYDVFLKDPSDFIVRYFLPRVFGSLAPLTKLPPLSSFYTGFDVVTALFASPEFEQLARVLARSGKEQRKYREIMGPLADELANLGFPAFSYPAAIRGAPFDAISAHLRGMKGSMLDMYRQPDKLLQACDVILDNWIRRSTPADPKTRGNPKRAGMPLWRGDKAFMSQKQFETFYWPGFKKALLAAIDLGYVPMPFFEAYFGERLECLLEIPKGKMVASVEHMDAVQAKEILGGHQCVMVHPPQSLRLASVPESEEYHKGLIDKCGKGGGFILWMVLPARGNPAEVKAMIESVRRHAEY